MYLVLPVPCSSLSGIDWIIGANDSLGYPEVYRSVCYDLCVGVLRCHETHYLRCKTSDSEEYRVVDRSEDELVVSYLVRPVLVLRSEVSREQSTQPTAVPIPKAALRFWNGKQYETAVRASVLYMPRNIESTILYSAITNMDTISGADILRRS